MIIDVRTEDEFNDGHVDKAINIPVQIIAKIVLPFGKEDTIEVYSVSGGRAQMAKLILSHRGFTNVKLYQGTGVMN